MGFHKSLVLEDIHRPYAWEYADTAARIGATGFVSADVGKIALQQDTNTLWLLTATTPTWKAVGGGDHSELTNLDYASAGHTGFAASGDLHDAVTLDTDADDILSLSTQEVGLQTQTANTVLAGRADAGTALVPTFRALVELDIPDLSGTYEAAGAVGTHEGTYDHSLLHSPVTIGTDSIDDVLELSTQELNLKTQAKNIVLAGPSSGADAKPTFRALTSDDIPSKTQVRLTIGDGSTLIANDTNGTFFIAPVGFTITEWRIWTTDESSKTIQTTIKKNGTTIGQDVDLSAAASASGTGLSIAVAATDKLSFNVDSNTDAKKVIIQLVMKES